VQLVDHAAGVVDHPRLVVEALDLVASAVLDMAGVAPEPARANPATLWLSDTARRSDSDTRIQARSLQNQAEIP
jgi:hypothetical protein